MRLIGLLLCLITAPAHAGGLPEIFVSEVSIADGGIYTVTINQPPAPPNPIWHMTAWGIANQPATSADSMHTGWTGAVFDDVSWDSGIAFETDTPDLPIFLFSSGINGISDFETLFGPGFIQAAVYWNESYIGPPLVATSSNFTWMEVVRIPVERQGGTRQFVVITSTNGQNLICTMGFEMSLPLDCTPITEADADGDLVPDSSDNCTLVANPNQEDTDFDGFGNICDADFNGDFIVNFLDVGLFVNVFMTNDVNADLNSDGAVNFLDFGIMVNFLFFLPPGPSAGF